MTENVAEKIMRFRWLIFIVLALAYFFVYFHRLSLSVVANDLIKDFKTTASVIGLLGSIYFYCYAFMQFPAGLLSDSLGPRKSVTFFLLIASAGSILFGVQKQGLPASRMQQDDPVRLDAVDLGFVGHPFVCGIAARTFLFALDDGTGLPLVSGIGTRPSLEPESGCWGAETRLG